MKPNWLTAITRTKLSLPSKYLIEENLIEERGLDYGCGRGKDAELLGFEKYDPHWFPTMPTGLFDCIICNYVLNVVDSSEVDGILWDIESRLTTNGFAYISVRRDLKGNEPGQYLVYLDLPILFENSSFCIYETWK